MAPASSAYATAGIACSNKTVLVMTNLAKLRTRAFFAQQCHCVYCSLPIWEPPYRERFAEALGIPEALLPTFNQPLSTCLLGRKGVKIVASILRQLATGAIGSAMLIGMLALQIPSVSGRRYAGE